MSLLIIFAGSSQGEAPTLVVGKGEIVTAPERPTLQARDRYTVKAGDKQTVTARRGKDRLGNDG